MKTTYAILEGTDAALAAVCAALIIGAIVGGVIFIWWHRKH